MAIVNSKLLVYQRVSFCTMPYPTLRFAVRSLYPSLTGQGMNSWTLHHPPLRQMKPCSSPAEVGDVGGWSPSCLHCLHCLGGFRMLWFGDKSTSAKKEVRRIANQAGKTPGFSCATQGAGKGHKNQERLTDLHSESWKKASRNSLNCFLPWYLQ